MKFNWYTTLATSEQTWQPNNSVRPFTSNKFLITWNRITKDKRLELIIIFTYLLTYSMQQSLENLTDLKLVKKFPLNIILPSTPGSPKWFLSFRFPHQYPVYASPLPHTRYMPRPSHSSRFYHPNNIGWAVQFIKAPHCVVFSSSAPYHRERDPVPVVQEVRWVPWPVWTGAENLFATRIRSPDRPPHSESLYRLSYPGQR